MFEFGLERSDNDEREREREREREIFLWFSTDRSIGQVDFFGLYQWVDWVNVFS